MFRIVFFRVDFLKATLFHVIHFFVSKLIKIIAHRVYAYGKCGMEACITIIDEIAKCFDVCVDIPLGDSNCFLFSLGWGKVRKFNL